MIRVDWIVCIYRVWHGSTHRRAIRDFGRLSIFAELSHVHRVVKRIKKDKG